MNNAKQKQSYKKQPSEKNCSFTTDVSNVSPNIRPKQKHSMKRSKSTQNALILPFFPFASAHRLYFVPTADRLCLLWKQGTITRV